MACCAPPLFSVSIRGLYNSYQFVRLTIPSSRVINNGGVSSLRVGISLIVVRLQTTYILTVSRPASVILTPGLVKRIYTKSNKAFLIKIYPSVDPVSMFGYINKTQTSCYVK